jgi:hypothetical protein
VLTDDMVAGEGLGEAREVDARRGHRVGGGEDLERKVLEKPEKWMRVVDIVSGAVRTSSGIQCTLASSALATLASAWAGTPKTNGAILIFGR